jgi:hypothetical protein
MTTHTRAAEKGARGSIIDAGHHRRHLRQHRLCALAIRAGMG